MLNEYWQAHKAWVIAKQRYDQADPSNPAEIDARAYELLAAELRFNAVQLEAKVLQKSKEEGVKTNAGSERFLSQRSVGAS